MLILLYGPPKSGKSTIIEYLKKKSYTHINYTPTLFHDIVQKKAWRSNYITILPTLQDWAIFEKRPLARLVILFAPNKSSWRFINDDEFYYEVFKHNIEYKIPNYKTIKDLEFNIDLILTKIRPSWDKYFMDITNKVSLRSNCMKGRVGCVIVKDNRIVSTGYNGSILKNCYMDGCDRCNEGKGANVDLEYCWCLHAEESAMLYLGRECLGSVLYVTRFPCRLCCRKILSMGVKKVVYAKGYGEYDWRMEEILKEGQVEVVKYEQ